MNLKACLFCGMTTIAFAAAGLTTFALESRQTPASGQPQAGRGAARGGQRGATVISPAKADTLVRPPPKS